MKHLRKAALVFSLAGDGGGIVFGRADRQRIGAYVASGQQFLVVDSENSDETISLFEDPGAELVMPVYVFWFCPPKHAPDRNGDGEFDNVLGHALTYRAAIETIVDQGSDVSGTWSPHGYTAAWNPGSGVYEEFLIDYDDSTVWKFIESEGNTASILGWETSLAGDNSGLAISGAGQWLVGNNATTNSTRLDLMAKDLGKDLTGEACLEKYAEVWESANAVTSDNAVTSGTMSVAAVKPFLVLGAGVALSTIFSSVHAF
ncbi:hypothetical protein ACHAWF_001065 [Thalassiosira exigua]